MQIKISDEYNYSVEYKLEKYCFSAVTIGNVIT